MRHVLERLWSLPLLFFGSAVSYQFLPTALGVVALLFSVFLFLPLVIVSLIDVRRAKSLQSQPAFLEMNMPPPRRLFGGPIASALDRTVALSTSLDVLGQLVAVIAGIGALGYVGVLWLIHFASHAQYLAAPATALLALVAIGFAFARIPAALIVVIGGAAFCGVAFLSGYGNALLP